MMKSAIFLSVVILSLGSFPAAVAQNNSGAENKVLRAVRVETAPVIDGIIDEAEWALAEPITDFHQIRPGDQAPASERTEVRVIYTEDAIYIAARMDDSNPELMAAPTIRHGQGLGPDDRLVVIIDPFNTRRTGYRFETNLNGVRNDSLYTSLNNADQNWSAIWDTKTSTYENGWIAEIEIPFKSISMDPNTQEWGFNFGRGIRRRNEELAWVSFNRSYNPSIAGTLTGMSGMSQGVGLDVVPSMSVTQSKNHVTDATTDNLNPSLDAFYRLTPSLNAALTVNTDFSAVDVDNRQVNLGQFSLFFPERRDFFLNDSDLFQFGNIGENGNEVATGAAIQNARPYFSRRIGLGPGGVPVDINYGGRVSGRVGRWNIGTLAIRQDAFGSVDPSNLFIGRLSANVLQESNVGFIVTEGDPTSNRDNRVFGADFRYLNTRLASGAALEADAWVQRSDTPGLVGDDASWGFGIRSPNNQGWGGGFGFKEVQKNFNPAMGFVNNAGIQDFYGNFRYSHFFEPGGRFQMAWAGFDGQRINFIDGGLQFESLRVTFLEAFTTTRDMIRLRAGNDREVVRAPFTVYREPGRTVQIQPGEYELSRWGGRFDTGNQRQISMELGGGFGGYYDGDRNNANITLRWAPRNKNLIVSSGYDYNDVKLPQGDFKIRLVTFNAQYAFSTDLYWISLVQYDTASEMMGINTRLQWIPTAGQEGIIVLNYNLEDLDKDNSFRSMTTDLSIRFRYTFRF